MRPTFTWRLRSRSLQLGPRTLIMGILNVTPDSFSDGGAYLSPDTAVEHGLEMLCQGADIIDIGGESTRPGARVSPGGDPVAAAVSTEEELRRVLPVLYGLKRAAPDAIISVDTYKAVVARGAVAAGAEIVNDVSALRWDPAMAETVAELGCGVVLMHMRGRPEEWRTLTHLDGDEMFLLVCRELREWVAAAQRAGIERERIVVDPGFGFGKNLGENFPMLARLGDLQQLGYPMLAGTSRKAFIGRAVARTSEPAGPEQRLYGTLASVTASVLHGAHVVRVHDVGPARDAVAIADAILNARTIQRTATEIQG